METLTSDITTFVKSTKTFQEIMGSQSGVFDIIGFKKFENQNIYKNFFLPQKNNHTNYSHRKKEGHSEEKCVINQTYPRRCRYYIKKLIILNPTVTLKRKKTPLK